MEHEERFPNYIAVWLVLMALTAASIVVSLLVTESQYAAQLGSALVAFLFIVGTIKALLVAMFFMNLKFESRLIWILSITALIFVGCFLAGTVIDITATVKR